MPNYSYLFRNMQLKFECISSNYTGILYLHLFQIHVNDARKIHDLIKSVII